MTTYKVGYFVGSLAKGSINRLLSKALVRLAPEHLEMVEIPIRELPLYSYDYDANYPPVATEFKNAIAAVDAVLFVTPEGLRAKEFCPHGRLAQSMAFFSAPGIERLYSGVTKRTASAA